jgi:UDP-perosamine 4-acetyltransferase
MRTRIVLLGAGGHAKVIADILLDSDEVEIAGCITLGREDSLLGIPVLGGDDQLPQLRASGITMAFPAIGDNARRMAALDRLRDLGFTLVNAISRRASVSPRASLGSGIAIMPGAVVNVASTVNDGAIINTGATVDHDCEIGRCAHIAPGCHLAGKVRVGDGAFLGVGVSVIPALAIGAWTVVGAGAVVIRDLPAQAKAVGVPALLCDKEVSS